MRSALVTCVACISAQLALIGCTGDDTGTATDGGPQPDLASTAPDLSTAVPQAVSFSYTPQWQGVTKVEVIGGFGQMTDWSTTTPLVTLANSGSGTFTGTAMLPPGTYLYIFRVTGDEAGANPATLMRYSIDPQDPAYADCPAQSPTYSAAAPNPCSQLSVPQGAAATLYHVKGGVNYGGAAIAGYLIEVERDETNSHHFFVNRATTAADGSYDVPVAAGSYRVQVLHPSFYNKTDAARTPLTLKAQRRDISSAFAVAADVTVPTPEMAYNSYNQFAPVTSPQPLPTAQAPLTFTFALSTGVTLATLDVYGLPNANAVDIGNPWYASAAANKTAVMWSGAFPTKAATETMAKAGEKYYWGIEEQLPKNGAAITWTAQSMVFPVTFQ